MKTLKEKRQELLNKNIRFVDKTCKRLVLEIVEKQDKEFIEEILDEIDKSIKQDIEKRMFPKNISIAYKNYFKGLIKDKSGFDK